MKKYMKKWKRRTWKSFKKKFPISLINILIIILGTYIMMDIVLKFGILSLLGYLAYSIINLNKLIEKPTKSFLWAIMYIISAIIFDTLLTNVLPLLSKGTGASIFSGFILLTILIMAWSKNKKLK